MAGVIMRRMRQISMTESDNVVDIVKQVMGATTDYRYSSTDSSLDLQVTPGPRRRLDKLKHVQSEPQLKKVAGQRKTLSDDDSEDNMSRCRSTQSLQQRRKLYRHHRRASRQNGTLHHIQATENDTQC
ncbi:hypothetical protein NP493_1054g00077 [Ridgeia piscesae]|uniref:Uncharacterized protein n=1 Tax=Ridgeia piscesae TaxID=27915 RepID=A0AAD9KH69_RIDPI|nr:hypothetical protein NP493_1054g00077 [Ridgeia piscesae]